MKFNLIALVVLVSGAIGCQSSAPEDVKSDLAKAVSQANESARKNAELQKAISDLGNQVHTLNDENGSLKKMVNDLTDTLLKYKTSIEALESKSNILDGRLNSLGRAFTQQRTRVAAASTARSATPVRSAPANRAPARRGVPQGTMYRSR